MLLNLSFSSQLVKEHNPCSKKLPKFITLLEIWRHMSAYQPHDTTDNNVTASNQRKIQNPWKTFKWIKSPALGLWTARRRRERRSLTGKSWSLPTFSSRLMWVNLLLKHGSFSSLETQVRKITMDENPGVKFGEISRIVAERWRGMSDADKQVGVQQWHWQRQRTVRGNFRC